MASIGVAMAGTAFTYFATPAYAEYLFLKFIGSWPADMEPPEVGSLAATIGVGALSGLLLASPCLYYLRLIKELNLQREFINTKQVDLRTHFYLMQEWACDVSNPARQCTAFNQLRDFLRGDHQYFPGEIRKDREWYQERAREFFQLLLKNRALWDRKSDPDSTDKNPVQAVLEAILVSDGFRIRNLRSAELSRFNLDFAALSRVDFAEADLSHAQLYGATLSEANFKEGILKNTNFAAAYASRANFEGAILEQAVFATSRLVRANFTAADLRSTEFSHADLQSATLDHADITLAEFDDVNCRGASLYCTDLTKATLQHSILTNLDLRAVKFEDADLQWVEVDGSIVNEKWRSLFKEASGTPRWDTGEIPEDFGPRSGP